MANTDNELFDGLEEMDNLDDLLGGFDSEIDTDNLFDEENDDKLQAEAIEAEDDALLDSLNNNAQDDEDDDFLAAMNEQIKGMETGAVSDSDLFVDDRAREASKKLPEWSLEPPYSL